MKLNFRLLVVGSCVCAVSAQQVIKSCRPTCIAFRLNRSALGCHRTGAFAFLPSPWDLDLLDASPCNNVTTTIFARGASAPLPENLSVRIDESGHTDEVTSSRFDLYGTDVITHCSDYSCPETECTSTDQMGSILQVHFFLLGLADEAPMMSITLGLSLTFDDGDPIGAYGSTRFGSLIPLWMDDPYFCRTRKPSPIAAPSFIESQSPSLTTSSTTPSMRPSSPPPSNIISPLLPSVVQTEWPSMLPSVLPTFHESSGVPSLYLTLDTSEQSSVPEPTLFPSESWSTEPTETPSRVPTKVPSIHPSDVSSTTMPTSAPPFYSSTTPSVQPEAKVLSAQPSHGSYVATPTLPKAATFSNAPTPYPTITMYTGNALGGEIPPTEERKPYRGKSIIVLVVAVVAFLASVAAVMKHVVDRRRARDFLASFGSDSSQGEASVVSRAPMDFARLAGKRPVSPTEASLPTTTSSSERSRRIGINPVYSLEKGGKENGVGTEKPRSIILASSQTVGLELVPSVARTDSSTKPFGSNILGLPSVATADWHSPRAYGMHDGDEDMSVSTCASPPLSIGCEFSCSAGDSLSLQEPSSLPAVTFRNQQRSLATSHSVLDHHPAKDPHLSTKLFTQSPLHDSQSRSPHLLQYNPSVDENDDEMEALSPSPYPNVLMISDSFRLEATSKATECAPWRMTWGRFLNPLNETRPPGEEDPNMPEDMGVYGSLLDQNCGLDSYSDVSLSYDSSSPIWAGKKATLFDEIDLASDNDDNEYTSPYKDALYSDAQEKEATAQGQDCYSASNLRRWLFPYTTSKKSNKSWLPVYSHYYGKE